MSAAEKLSALIEIRKSGQRPADMVILSLCGRMRTSNPCIVIEDFEDVRHLDVRGLVKLHVEIAHIGLNLKRVNDLIWHVWGSTDVESLSACDYVSETTILVGQQGRLIISEAA